MDARRGCPIGSYPGKQKNPAEGVMRQSVVNRTAIATAGHYLGDLLRRRNPQRALEVYDHSLMRVREIPDDVAARRLEVLLLAGSSYAARRMHPESDAAARIEAAFRRLRDIGDYPAAVLKPGGEADITLRALADHDAETGHLDEAIRKYQELRRGLLASNPNPRGDLLNAISLTRLDASLAALLRRAGAWTRRPLSRPPTGRSGEAGTAGSLTTRSFAAPARGSETALEAVHSPAHSAKPANAYLINVTSSRGRWGKSRVVGKYLVNVKRRPS